MNFDQAYRILRNEIPDNSDLGYHTSIAYMAATVEHEKDKLAVFRKALSRMLESDGEQNYIKITDHTIEKLAKIMQDDLG